MVRERKGSGNKASIVQVLQSIKQVPDRPPVLYAFANYVAEKLGTYIEDNLRPIGFVNVVVLALSEVRSMVANPGSRTIPGLERIGEEDISALRNKYIPEILERIASQIDLRDKPAEEYRRRMGLKISR